MLRPDQYENKLGGYQNGDARRIWRVRYHTGSAKEKVLKTVDFATRDEALTLIDEVKARRRNLRVIGEPTIQAIRVAASHKSA